MLHKIACFCIAFASLAVPVRADDGSAILSKIQLPPGFRIEVFAQLPSPRQMAFDAASGVIYVGSRRGHVHALADRDGDGGAEEVRRIAHGLHVPNGVAVRDGRLFIGLQDRIAYWPIPDAGAVPGPIDRLITVNDRMTDRRSHGWRYIAFGPDGRLYVALGAPCNICDLAATTGKIARMNADGSGWEVVADGVRNSVGFDWHPATGALWFTDNGADGMGDDIPPDELNRVTGVGQHFGFSYLGGKDTVLTGYEGRDAPASATPAEIEFQAHTANLGIDFYQGDMFPADYRNDAFVAQHGSWNRSEPVGYRIMRIRFDSAGNATGKEVFATGWLENSDVAGRPVDIEELPDGSILVSDDHADLIYRISYAP